MDICHSIIVTFWWNNVIYGFENECYMDSGDIYVPQKQKETKDFMKYYD